MNRQIKINGSFRWLLLVSAFLCNEALFAQIDTIFKLPKEERRMAFFRATIFNGHTLVGKFEQLKLKAKQEKDQLLLGQIELGEKTLNLYNLPIKERIKGYKGLKDWVVSRKNKEMLAAYNCVLGNLLIENNTYAEGFALMLEGINEFEKIGFINIPEVGYYLNQLGNKYYHFEDYDKALYYLEQSEKLEQIIPRFLLDNLNTQSLIWYKKNNVTNAINKITQCITEAEQKGDTVWIGIANGNLGNFELRQGNLTAAIQHLLIDYNYNKLTEPDNTATSCLYLAEAYLKTNNFSQTLFYCNEAKRLRTEAAKQNSKAHNKFMEQYYRLMSSYAMANGNSVLAYHYADSCIAVKDSLKLNANAQIIASAENRIEVQKHLADLDLVKKEKDNSLLRRNLWIAMAIAGLTILCVLLYFKNKQGKKNKIIFEQKEKTIIAEKEASDAKLKIAETALTEYLKTTTAKNEQLEKMRTELYEANEIKNETQRYEKINDLLQFSLITDEEWMNFKKLFDAQFPGYSVGIKEKLPWLSPAETRLLLLMKLNLSNKEIASMLGIAQASVNKLKYRFRKRMAEDEQYMDLEKLLQMQ